LHTTGDAALRHLANLIRNTVREADVVARYGGDEFSVILPRCTPFGLEVVAEKTWRVIRNTPLILEGGKELALSVSVGAAMYPEDAVTARDLLQQADAALFVAKRQRDQVRIGPEARLPFTSGYEASQSYAAESPVEPLPPENGLSFQPRQNMAATEVYRPEEQLRSLQEFDERLETTSRQLAEVSTQAIRWENALWEVLRLIAQLIERREPEFAGGAEKVVRLVRLLADELKLSQPEIRGLQAAGWLANLGRITLPDTLYGRAGPLSEQEWEKMQRYTEDGAELASFLATHLPPGTFPAIRFQRERFDGTGYPRQLAGEAIPLPARILGISTALVAMTQPRPFRPALNQAKCQQEIEQAAGKQFDPELVVLTLKFMEQGKLDFLEFS
jgi:HD-GYP domain-containing protein (c-di-GMP phosphodiesterase class II)